jgi:outer membrane lipoprotein-sorting protein
LSDDDKAAVDKATAYLQDLKTVSGRFTQVSANGATSTGQFYMQRPGKARFQYDPPAQMLVVSDGHNVSIYDQRLKSFDQYPLGSTPLVLLLAREVRLDRGVIITGVERTDQGFSINARDARKQAEGRLTLNFSNEPVALKGWTIVDGQGQETRVRLGTLSPVSGLDPSLFTLRDPRARSGRP